MKRIKIIKKFLSFYNRIYRKVSIKLTMCYASRYLKKNMLLKREPHILFVCQCESIFDKFENLFLEFKKRNIVVTLYVVPDDNSTLKYSKKRFDYHKTIFESKYPDNCITYEKDGLKHIKPSLVIYTRPYNKYLPKDVRSYKVVKYSKTALIPYGYSLTKQYHLFYRMFPTINYFISDGPSGKEAFDNFCKKGVWKGYQKSLDLGFPEFENIVNIRGKSDFKNIGGYKIMWTPRWTLDPNSFGGSNYLKYKEDIFKITINNNKYSFIFRPHPLMFDFLIREGSVTQEETSSLLQSISESTNSFYDNSNHYLRNFKDCDLLITDFSSIIPEYFIYGNPFIFCATGNNLDVYNFSENIKKMIECNYVAYNINDVIKLIEDIRKNDYKKSDRELYVSEFLKYHNCSSKRIVDELLIECL